MPHLQMTSASVAARTVQMPYSPPQAPSESTWTWLWGLGWKAREMYCPYKQEMSWADGEDSESISFFCFGCYRNMNGLQMEITTVTCVRETETKNEPEWGEDCSKVRRSPNSREIRGCKLCCACNEIIENFAMKAELSCSFRYEKYCKLEV